jgi:hypothetical protein
MEFYYLTRFLIFISVGWVPGWNPGIKEIDQIGMT